MSRRSQHFIGLSSVALLLLMAVIAGVLSQYPPVQATTTDAPCTSHFEGKRTGTGDRTLRVGSSSHYLYNIKALFQPLGTPDGDVTVTITSSDNSIVKVTNNATTRVPVKREGWGYRNLYSLTPVSAGDATLTYTVINGNNLCEVGTEATRKLFVLAENPVYDLQLATYYDDEMVNQGGASTHAFGLRANPRGTVTVSVSSSDPRIIKVSPTTLTLDGGNWWIRWLNVYAVATGKATLTYEVVKDTGGHYTVGDKITKTYHVKYGYPPPPQTETITITPSGDINEGGLASFIITADKAPTTDLRVRVQLGERSVHTSIIHNDVVPDHNERTHLVTIKGGQTQQTLKVQSFDDSPVDEDALIIATVLPDPTYLIGKPKTATVRVTDDDAPCVAPYIRGRQIRKLSTSTDTTFRHQYKLNRDPEGDVTVNVTIEKNGAEYPSLGTVSPSTLTFNSSKLYNVAQEVTVTKKGGVAGTAHLVFRVASNSNSSNAHCKVNDTGKVFLTVYKPAVRITAGSIVTEGTDTHATFTVRAGEQGWYGDRPNRYAQFRDKDFTLPQALTVTVSYEQVGDFMDSGAPSSVTIKANEREATVEVPIHNDTLDEEDGSIVVTLADPGDSGAYVLYETTLGYVMDSAATPVNDDDPVGTMISMSSGSMSEGDTRELTVSIDTPMQGGMSVALPITDSGTASHDTDYSLQCESPLPKGVTCHNLNGSNGQVRFTGSAGGSATEVTLKLHVQSDSVDDDGETIDLGIGAPIVVGSGGGASVGDNAPEITLNDDSAQQQQTQDDDSTFTPNQTLVDAVQQKADNHSNAGAAERLQKIVNGMTGEGDGYTSEECRQTARYYHVASVWKPWCDEIERRENAASSITPTPPPDPEISITAGSAIDEGGSAQFTLTATPALSSPLNVSVDVTQSGDFASVGSRTVTIPTTGSITFTVPTTDDSTDEPDGSVTATLQTGSGYMLGSATAAMVAVSDDDDRTPPEQDSQNDTTALEAGIQERIDLTAKNNDDHSNKIWRRALAAVRGEDPPEGLSELTASFAQKLADGHRRGGRITLADLWQDIADALNGNVPPPPPPPPPDPTIRIIAGPAVIEGGSATFTLTANPAATSPLTVSVNVSQVGDYASVGARTVTITGATATLTIATVDDSTDEPSGSITATLQAGSGYSVGASSAATVAVSDDDDPPPPPVVPQLTISSGANVREGGDAVFTISADQAPTPPLTVSLKVTQSGDFASVGASTVTLSGASTTFRVATINDTVNEANGSITATLQAGAGYTIGASSSATVSVSDNDDPPPPPPPPPDTQDAAVKADLIDRTTVLVNSPDFMVSFRAQQTLDALNGVSNLASNPNTAPYHFRAAISAAYRAGDFAAAQLFGEARDFLGVSQ